MRVLVTGSNGFIGRGLVGALRARGDEVRPIVRTPGIAGTVFLDLERARLVGPDGEDALAGTDAIVNLAGEPITPARWNAAKRERIRSSRIVTTSALASAIASAAEPPTVFVSASASGYYGDRGDELLTEASSPGRGFLAEVCRAWERATAAARAAEVRTVLLRTGLVLGDGGLLERLVPIFRLGLGGRLGSGRQWMSWISLDDEVAAISHLLVDEGAEGPFNLAGPAPVTNAAFTTALGDALGRPTRLSVPRRALELAIGKVTTEEVALASQRLSPERLVERDFAFADTDLGEVLARLFR